MTCYFRHLGTIFEEAGIAVTKENRNNLDELIHGIVGVDYKNCPEAWRRVKNMIGDDGGRELFIPKLRNAAGNLQS